MFLDLRTVILLSVFISLLTGSWVLINRSMLKDVSGFGFLGMAHFSLGASLVLLALRGVIPDFFSIVIANLLLILADTLGFTAIKHFRQVNVRGRRLCLTALFLQAAISGFFTYIQPNLLMRLLLGGLLSFALLLLCVRALLKNAEDFLRLPLLATAAPFLLNAIVSILRFGNTLLSHSPAELLHGDLFFSLQCVGADTILLGTALGFTSIANRKLSFHLEKEALTDPLTQVFNRRAAERIGRGILDHAKRHGTPASILLIDLDYFKKVNDFFGHPAGDQTLRQFANLVQNQLRDSDVLARYGGEEFIAVLPDGGRENAYAVAERIRSTVDRHDFSFEGTVIPLSVSIGFASFPEDEAEWSSLLAKADERLYEAKDGGRNLVSPASHPDFDPPFALENISSP